MFIKLHFHLLAKIIPGATGGYEVRMLEKPTILAALPSNAKPNAYDVTETNILGQNTQADFYVDCGNIANDTLADIVEKFYSDPKRKEDGVIKSMNPQENKFIQDFSLTMMSNENVLSTIRSSIPCSLI